MDVLKKTVMVMIMLMVAACGGGGGAEGPAAVRVQATMPTVVTGTTAVGTVSVTGLPVAAPYGLNFLVTMPTGATLAAVTTSGGYAGSGFASISGTNGLILASSNVASGEVMTVTFANVPSGAQAGDFGIEVSAVYDRNGSQIQ